MYTPEELFEKGFGGKDPAREAPHFIGVLLYAVLWFLTKLLFRLKVEGVEQLKHLPKDRGVILLANHTSYLDPVFLYVAAFKARWPRFMGRENLFEKNALLSFLIARVGAFPVKRDAADMTSIKRATNMLKNAEVVGIFPEGTRRGRGTAELKIHAGVSLLARMGKATIVPVGLVNVGEIKPPGAKKMRFVPIKVIFGEPYELQMFDALEKQDRLDAAAWYGMRASMALAYDKKPEDVDMKTLFPLDTDYTELLIEKGCMHA